MRKPAGKPAPPKGTTKKHAGGSKHPAGTGVQHGHLTGGKHKAAAPKGKHHPAHQHKSTAPAHKTAPPAHHTQVIKGRPPQDKAPAKPKTKQTKKRQLTPGAVSLCPAEALAASLRLTGRPVGADDVLALYWHTAATPDAGASILATLKAAAEYGLAGVRPVWFGAVPLEPERDFGIGQRGDAVPGVWGVPVGGLVADVDPVNVHASHGTPLILGVELPGSHALLAEPRGWWSWGDLHDPACWPAAVIEEAWAVRWPAWR